jgi:ribulose-phosphate 3-epimerase
MQNIVPAILTQGIADMDEKIEELQEATKWIHIDVMDGVFVPNTSFDLALWNSFPKDIDLEVHLMVDTPTAYFKDCERIGAARVLVHAEASEDISAVLDEIKQYSFEKGIVLKADTALDNLTVIAGRVDSVMLMSVVPGFQGQSFIPSSIERIKEVKKQFPDLLLGVDGGIDKTNIAEVFSAGADYTIIGSKIVKAENPKDALRGFQDMIQ